MKKLLSFLAVGSLLVSCTHQQWSTNDPPPRPPLLPDVSTVDVTLHVDSDCTINDKWTMKMAADTWNKQTNGLVNIKLVHDLNFSDKEGLNRHYLAGHDLLVCLEPGSYQVQEADKRAGSRLYGWVFPGSGVKSHRPVTVNMVSDRMYMGVRETVYIHEFGHLVGCDHIDPMDSVMYPFASFGSPECLKKADLDEFCRANDCGNVKLFPCE